MPQIRQPWRGGRRRRDGREPTTSVHGWACLSRRGTTGACHRWERLAAPRRCERRRRSGDLSGCSHQARFPCAATPDSRTCAPLRLRVLPLVRHRPWFALGPRWTACRPATSRPRVPRLGPYERRSRAVLEQHARWIAEAGVGAVDLSWWGRGAARTAPYPAVMDVLRDHDLKVTFHLEPYRDDRGRRYADDVLYLLREYGEKRRWDAFLLLDEARRVAPVFKGFRTILPARCRTADGRLSPCPTTRRTTTGAGRSTASRDAPRRLRPRHAPGRLAGLRAHARVRVRRHRDLRQLHGAGAVRASRRTRPRRALLFSSTSIPATTSTRIGNRPPRPPSTPVTAARLAPSRWQSPGLDRDAASVAAQDVRWSHPRVVRRYGDAEAAGGVVQWRAPVLPVYVNSFNAWHEGSQFEPTKDFEELTPMNGGSAITIRPTGWHGCATSAR